MQLYLSCMHFGLNLRGWYAKSNAEIARGAISALLFAYHPLI